MTWLLKISGEPETLYWMQDDQFTYIEKVNIDTSSFDDVFWLARTLERWLTHPTRAPKTLVKQVAGGPRPEPYKASEATDTMKPPGTAEPARKPNVIQRSSPNQSSRNGERIRSIVLHYTTSRNVEGSLSWFANPASRVSAHYVIAQNGTIYQCVADSQKAWHCANNNANTIGIEHAAQPGDKLTAAQEEASAALIRWLMSEYKVPLSGVTGHRFVPGQSTSCPGSLWPTVEALEEWKKKHLV